jgi:hypothetical protein
MLIKSILAKICIVCVLTLSINGCSQSNTSKHVYLFNTPQENQIHSVKSDFIVKTKDNENSIFHAVLSQNEQLEQALDIFYTDCLGDVKSNVRFTPSAESIIDENLIAFFETDSHLFLVFGSTSSGKDHNYTISFVPIDSKDTSLIGTNISEFSSKNISVSNYCYFKDRFYVSGQFSTRESQSMFGMVSTFLVNKAGEINSNNVSIIQVPNNPKTGLVNSNVSSIIPTFEKQNLEDQIDPQIIFSTQNGYVGTLSSNFLTKNCFIIPGYTPGFKNSIFTDGENTYFSNEPNDSYDPHLIMVKTNGKVEFIQFFNQRPDIEYSFSSNGSNPYSVSEGLYGFGIKDLTLELVLKYSDKKVEAWETKNLSLNSKIISKVYVNDLYMYGFSDNNSIIDSAIEVLFNSNNLTKWDSCFTKIVENTIPDTNNSFMYYQDQQNNTLDCKTTDREVSFVKPLFVSDFTESFFDIDKKKELVFKESKLIKLSDK